MPRARRRKMVSVDLHPSKHQDPVARFCIECSPIFTLFTHGLRASPEKIQATASWIRIFPQLKHTVPLHSAWADLGGGVLMELDEPPDNYGFSETLRVLVEESILAAQPSDRAELYLDWLHSVLTKAARFRGWEQQPLENARQYCIDRGLKAHFESPPKQSPDREHKAVLSLDIDTDGWRHRTITVRDRSGQVVAVSAQRFPAFFLDFYDWRTTRNQFRRISADEVQADNDYGVVPGTIVPGRHWISATVGRVNTIEEDSPEHPLQSVQGGRPSEWLREVAGLDDRY